MKKKPTKTTKTRTNWKQKYEDLNKGYERFVRETAHTRLQLSTTLEHLELERGVTDRMEQEKKALEVKNNQLHTTIKQLEHTLTILTQTGIATPEQCEIARRLAETIVKNEVPKQEGFKGLPYQVVPSGNWKGLDRSAYPSVKASVIGLTPTQIADIDNDIKDAMLEADKQLSNMIREIPTHPFEKKEGK